MSQNANFQMILQDYENVTTQIEMETRWEIYLAFTTYCFVPTCADQEFCRANLISCRAYLIKFRVTELTNNILEQEIERMQRENLELKLENDILKNAC